MTFIATTGLIRTSRFILERGAGIGSWSWAEGSDFYLPYFKFGLELRFSLGMTDVLVHRPDVAMPGYEHYTDALSKLRARIFTVCFNFE